MSYSHRSQDHHSENIKPICMLLMNVIYRICTMLLRPATFIVKLIYHMCFHRTNTLNTIQAYALWFYEAYMKIFLKNTEERIINYSCGYFFPETLHSNGFELHGFGVLLNLFGVFSFVFVVAMAFYPLITFLSIVIVLFILFQAIVNQGIVIYYYYFSENKNNSG